MKQNKFFIALKRTILFSATVHLLILFWHSISTGNLKVINLFNIIDLELIFPNIITGSLSDVFSFITLIIIYTVFLLNYKKHKK
jgi:hypothetical protein